MEVQHGTVPIFSGIEASTGLEGSGLAFNRPGNLAIFDNLNHPQLIRQQLARPDINVVIIRRPVPPFVPALEKINPKQEYNFSHIAADSDSLGRSFAAYLDRTAVPLLPADREAWQYDLENISGAFLQITGAQRIEAMMRNFDQHRTGPRCLHTDSLSQAEEKGYLPLHLLCTYCDRGTEWVTDDNLKISKKELNALQASARKLEDLLLRPQEIYSVPTCAIVILKGGDTGVVHRGPLAELKRIRLNLKIRD